MKKHTYVGWIWLVALLNPNSVKWLESSMVLYMLVHIPGLVAGGYLIGKAFCSRIPQKLKGWNRGGIPGLLAAVFTIAYWILPRSADAALNETVVDLWKFVSLPLFAGVPLAWSWPQIHPIIRGFVWSNLVSMLFVMSWLYLSAPVRLCNSFLEQQQILLGKASMLVGIVLAAFLVLQAFMGTGLSRSELQAKTQMRERRLDP